MSDEMNNPNMMNDPNRRLKKVKRPVNRAPSQGGQQGSPVSPRPQMQNPQQMRHQEIDAFNLDSYIDENSNLPALSEEDDVFGDAQNQYIPQQRNQQVRFIDDNDLLNEQHAAGIYPNMIAKKIAIAIGVGAFLVGMLAAKMMFGEQKVVRDGLQGVVVNAEVPRGRARCGVAEKTQGCVLYIMNPQRQELNASDFYDLASQLTGRQRFVIETGNMRYSNSKIKPGEIAQFNIPPLQ